MSAKPELSVFLSHLDHIIERDNSRIVEIAKIAEAVGIEQVVFSEHVTLAEVIQGKGEAAKFPFKSDENYPEPLVMLGAIAGCTTKLRLATGILIAPLRPPTVLAKLLATLDNVSRGRLDVGMGSGWHVPELEACGVEPDRALEHLDNAIGACRALWSGEPASYDSSTISLESLVCRPVPFQGQDLPIWLAGPPSIKGADRIARLGQGWLPFGNVALDGIKRGSDNLRIAERKYGLAEGSIGIRAPLPVISDPDVDRMLDLTFAGIDEYPAAGANSVQFALWRYVKTLDDVEPVLTKVRQRLDAAF
ncbi:hypothetical protein MB02_02885 [Croceicoccus estronivorus]|uniref:TIGR03619 family F420-dependent LLM class oxidoreductase n=1 Tax=Croceicoccus estronivorus TaxID=1172626 RepID=UPI00082F9BD5|nr:TIGR03619 family F420-dependent LLM class oxidoreductase [Croceicoccus estronivorus]OCC25592.1 hypothetical protein MB02_02885 [Croceicoccus estronivorus]